VIEVSELLRTMSKRLKLSLIAGRGGVQRLIREIDLHRPGLALAGFLELFPENRIQLIGNTETLYLSRRRKPVSKRLIDTLCSYNLPCIIVTNSNIPAPELIAACDAKQLPLIVSRLNTTELMFHLSNYLTDRFAPTDTLHGTLVDVYGTGILFTGRAGIGKSEIALDLVERGHRLVADDVVVVSRKSPGLLLGTGPEMLRHLIEIRGVGVIDVRQMFGVRAVRLQKRIETVIELADWNDSEDYERLGLIEKTREYLGIGIPLIQLPIYPGKNITVIVEAVALTHHMKVYGFNAAKELAARQAATMRQKKAIAEYLRWDRE